MTFVMTLLVTAAITAVVVILIVMKLVVPKSCQNGRINTEHDHCDSSPKVEKAVSVETAPLPPTAHKPAPMPAARMKQPPPRPPNKPRYT